jgi:ketosteroid isomerase-like protein/SAM-dependent methyltransferase
MRLSWRARNNRAVSAGAESHNTRLLTRFYEAWDGDDLATMLALVDPEFEYVNPPDAVHPGTRRGHEGLAGVMDVLHESFDHMSHDLLEVEEIGDGRVLWHTIFRARGRDSGALIEVDEQHLWTLQNGKILRLQWFHDLEDARRAANAAQRTVPTRSVDGLEVGAEISPHDEMHAEGHDEHYFRVGLSGLDAVRLGIRAAGAEPPRRILDLPCGHGRVLRFLTAAYPDAQITACDLNEDGVDFCARTSGATPVHSSEEPAEIPLDGEYDLIWCGSLLTHLDAEHFAAFLEVFERHLTEAGVLVFTVNGPCTAAMLEHTIAQADRPDEPMPDQADLTDRDRYRLWTRGYFTVPEEDMPAMLADYRRSGFGYADYEWARPQRATGSRGFGQCVSSPAWTCRQLERFEDLRLVTYLEQGFDVVQDVIACARPVNFVGSPMRGFHRLGR